MTTAPPDARPSDGPLSAFADEVRALAGRSHVPFSNEPRAAGLLLADGRWVPGVRVESASFSLVIPALLNALTTAVACGISADAVRAAVLSAPARPDESALLDLLPGASPREHSEAAFVFDYDGRLPAPRAMLDPYLGADLSDTASGLATARRLTERAQTPLSDFPVGCLLETNGGLVPGVNVEYADWSRTLCAERNALGTAVTYASGAASALYLTCPRAARSTPCGACRQLLLELASHATVWMDDQEEGPRKASPADLLPGGFTGQLLSS